MDFLAEAKKGRRIFCVDFPSGESIAFRTLTWQEFSTYKGLAQRGTIPVHILEKALFDQCVIDPYYIDNVYDMPAGIVATVGTIIMHLSGPSENPNEFNSTIEACRQYTDTLEAQIEMIICTAFPAYTPEDIRAMNWDVVMMRLAQAEKILMLSGKLETPLKMLSPEEREKGKHSGKFDIEQEMKETASGMHQVDYGITSDMTERKDVQLQRRAQEQKQQRQNANERIQNLMKRRRRG